ncbi:MAG: hypothetical protein KF744_12480 [Taibaiella sp.]|nr:hypothetical protein [Taibaiella sp.]
MTTFDNVHRRLLVVITLILFLPLLNSVLGFVKSGPLEGVVKVPEKVDISLHSWWDGSFQEYQNEWVNENIGFRPDLVRMNNQVNYWLFRRFNGNSVVIGKDDYLFDRAYIDEYNGLNYSGDIAILSQCAKLKMLQDTMQRAGKVLIFAIAPSKPYLYPRHVPSYLTIERNFRTNYESYSRVMDSLGIRLLDFNGRYMKEADTGACHRMAKKGVHWSVYNATTSFQKFTGFVEHACSVSLPHLFIDKLEISNTARPPDNDLARITNLVYPIAKEQLAYPQTHLADTAGSTRLRMIFIGDSFMRIWYDLGFLGNIGSRWEFWDYFNTLCNDDVLAGRAQKAPLTETHWKKSLDSAECVVLMFTPPNLAWAFSPGSCVGPMFDYYFPELAASKKNQE